MIEHYDYEHHLTDFIDDICICMAAKARGNNKWNISPEELTIASRAKGRLLQRGSNLLRSRAAQLRLDNIKEEYNSFKKVCIEDGLIESDK